MTEPSLERKVTERLLPVVVFLRKRRDLRRVVFSPLPAEEEEAPQSSQSRQQENDEVEGAGAHSLPSLSRPKATAEISDSAAISTPDTRGKLSTHRSSAMCMASAPESALRVEYQ